MTRQKNHREKAPDGVHCRKRNHTARTRRILLGIKSLRRHVRGLEHTGHTREFSTPTSGEFVSRNRDCVH